MVASRNGRGAVSERNSENVILPSEKHDLLIFDEFRGLLAQKSTQSSILRNVKKTFSREKKTF